MKKIFTFFLLYLGLVSLYAKEYTILTGSCKTFNSILKTQNDAEYQIRYDDAEEQYYFLYADWINTSVVCITEKQIDSFRNSLEKYFEWEKTAKEKGVTIEKEIPNSAITSSVIWKSGDTWYGNSGFTVKFTFFSQNEKRHQLVLTSNKVKSNTNQFITYELDDLYFDYNDVITLQKGFSESFLKEKIQEGKKQQEIEDLFN